MEDIATKRELMEMSRRLIPNMDEVEINTLLVTYNAIISHMLERGVETTED